MDKGMLILVVLLVLLAVVGYFVLGFKTTALVVLGSALFHTIAKLIL